MGLTMFLDFRFLFGKKIGIRLAKWCFTWLLALLPILFHVLYLYWNDGEVDMDKLCSSGEFFLVCIVMIAEPLSDLIRAGKQSTLPFIVGLSSIVFVTTTTFMYTLVNISEKENKITNCTLEHCNIPWHSAALADSLQVKVELVKHKEEKETNVKGKVSNIKEGRLKKMSIIFLLCSLILGLISVCIANFEEQYHP